MNPAWSAVLSTALAGLAQGLVVTLAAVGVFSLFTLDQLSGLKRLGSDIVDRNRRDSLQLIRIQDDISQLGLALRDAATGCWAWRQRPEARIGPSFTPSQPMSRGDRSPAGCWVP